MAKEGTVQKKGLVSCITPVWNGEKYIAYMLDSVLRQSYPLIEMILVDDGSEDHTLEIAEGYREKFADKGYEYQIVYTRHKNASAAINRGLERIQGEYLIWPDSDDVLEKDSIKKRVDFLAGNPEYSSVRSLMFYFDDDGQMVSDNEKIGDITEEKLFWDILYSRTFVCCGCYMLRTKDFFTVYPKRCIPESPVGQNFQILLPYMYRYNCHTIPETLYGVRVHEDSHSRKTRTQKEEEDRYKGFEKLIDEISRICQIRCFFEKKNIICWKLQRRYSIARKYGKHLKAMEAKLLLSIFHEHAAGKR